MKWLSTLMLAGVVAVGLIAQPAAGQLPGGRLPEERSTLEKSQGAVLGAGYDDKRVLVSSMPDSITPSTTKGPYYHMSENELRARKFFRGLGNVGLCVGEIPNQMFQQAYRTSPVTGIFVGAGKGLVKGGKRLVIGAWEMLTFFHPGKNYYQPYIEPEVVFQEYLH